MINNPSGFSSWYVSGKNQNGSLGPFNILPSGISGIFDVRAVLACDAIDTSGKTVLPLITSQYKGTAGGGNLPQLTCSVVGIYNSSTTNILRNIPHDGVIALTCTLSVAGTPGNDLWEYTIVIVKVSNLP